MCGRFTLRQSAETLADLFQLDHLPAIEPRYNIAPTQAAPTVLTAAGDRQFRPLYWGLIPSWSKDPSIGVRMINARAETVAEKPAFRSALKRRRCLILADGFYEWRQQGKHKQPFYFQVKQQPFAFAGLWEQWQGPDGSEIDSCTILTTAANALLEPIHDRMPVILAPQDYALWLDPEVQQPDRLQPLLRPYDADQMTSYAVSTQVNNPRHDSPDCIEPVAA